jgi:hypothetical protein
MSCGTRAPDFRPGDPDGAGSSVLPSVINYLPSGILRTAGDANYSVACDSATLRQPAPSPVLRLLWLEPHCQTSRCARPQPTPSPRCCSLTHCWVLLSCSRRPLITAAARCGRQSVAVLQQPWLRNSTTAPSCELRVLLAGSSSLPDLAVSLSYERNHSHANVQCLPRPI